MFSHRKGISVACHSLRSLSFSGRSRHNANFVGYQGASDNEVDSDFAFTLSENREETCNSTRCRKSVLEVSASGVTTQVLIDTGSVSNIMGLDEYRELKARGLYAKMEEYHKLPYACGGGKLEVIGHLSAENSVGGKTVNSQFVVIEKGRCPLGNASSKALGLLRIGPGADVDCECNAVGEDLATVLQGKHSKVFDGAGKLKDYKLKLHVDSDVTPIAQKPQRVPFALQEEVTWKVEELIAMDIVERVDGPTSWVIPVVVAPKASGNIRLYVDMRKADQAIIREQKLMPTIDEVVENLNGGRVFSKLDRRLGFHQIELPSCGPVNVLTSIYLGYQLLI